MPLLKTAEILAEDNIRHNVDDASVKDLALSILSVHELSNGEKALLQPVTVEKLDKKTKEGHTHRLRYGFRRLAAVQYLAETYPEKCFWAKAIQVIVDQAPDNEESGALSSFRLVENVQREDMTLLEEAHAIKRVMKDLNLKQADVAKQLGKSKGWISQRLALLRMDESVQLGVQDGKFGQAHVRELARIKKKADQSEIATKLLKEKKGASVDQVRRAVNKVVGPPTEKKSSKKPATAPAPAPETGTDTAPDAGQLDLSGTETGRSSSAEENASAEPKAAPELTREDVLKSMDHKAKVNFLKEEAHGRDETAQKLDVLEASEDTRTSMLETEAKRCAKRAAEARKKGNDLEAAHFNGAEQAIKFALGSVKSIRYSDKKAAS